MSFLHRLKQGIVLSRSSLGVALTTVLRVRVESTTIRRVCAFGFLRQECKTMKEPGWENAAAAKQVLYECVWARWLDLSRHRHVAAHTFCKNGSQSRAPKDLV
jgi:hypothetical protein